MLLYNIANVVYNISIDVITYPIGEDSSSRFLESTSPKFGATPFNGVVPFSSLFHMS